MLFDYKARGTTLTREVRGGTTTFLTMAYILLANPAILAAAGVPIEAAVAGTAAAAAITTIMMGLFANVPLALAPGMGLNAIIAFQVAPALGSWQAAMGLVIVDGIIILILVLLGAREAVLNAIPVDLRRAIGVGIGFFIAFIGLVNARLVIVPSGTIAGMTSDPSSVLPPVTFGSLREPEAIIAFIGLVVIGVLMARRVPGAILLGIAASTIVALILGVGSLPSAIFDTPSFATFGAADMSKALTLTAVPLLISVIMVDFFDTMGTATAVMDEAGLEDGIGRIPKLRELLAVDSMGAIIGGLFGVSSTTAYVESAAGVAEGARTGMHNIVVGALFLAAIFIAPVFAIVPGAATAPALIVVGFLMCSGITRIDFRTVASGLPAFILMVMVPMTYSIAHGIGYGFTSYVLISLFTGRGRDVHPLMYGTAAVFLAYFILG